MLLPKIRTEPVIRRMSLKTPARVRTRPLPAPTRKTAAMFNKNATDALLRRIHGLLKKGQSTIVSGVTGQGKR